MLEAGALVKQDVGAVPNVTQQRQATQQVLEARAELAITHEADRNVDAS